jgi:hypothetical protein
MEDNADQSSALGRRIDQTDSTGGGITSISTYKNRMPPREKYADVSSLSRKKTEPLMRAWTMKVLGSHSSVAMEKVDDRRGAQ